MSDDANEATSSDDAFEVEAYGECPRCALGVTATLLVLAGTRGRLTELVECPSCEAAIELVVDIPKRTATDELSTDLIC
jgi:hypothetical protein